jgi:chemotaxis protein methyltransferase WspC
MVYPDFETLLKEAIGLDAASVGTSAVERAVQLRMSAGKIRDAQAYWEIVKASAAELQQLIEAVVVPETWFFRDREAFEMLERIAREEWPRTHPDSILRLLSLPCSSGEESCSMAMTLLDAGLPPDRHRIDAVDISEHILLRARSGIYGKNSFRSADLAFRDRHFEKIAHGYRLNDSVRRQVHYRRGNILAPEFALTAEPYDIIFCRNLLIYFDRPTQDRAVQVLERLLAPNGVLFVGPSETALLLSHDWVSIKAPMAFAFRRADAAARAKASVPAWPAGRKAALAKPVKPIAARRHTNSAPPPPAQPDPAIDPGIDEAARLADQGRLAEATQSCEEYLRKHGSSVQALHLMGLVRAAAGDLTIAAQYYRKALYLDPNHHDALLHLGMLLDEQGDAAGARVIRDRILRLRNQSST